MPELNSRVESFITLLLNVTGRARPADLEAHSVVGAEELLSAYAAAHPEMGVVFDGGGLAVAAQAAPEPAAPPEPAIEPVTVPAPEPVAAPQPGPFDEHIAPASAPFVDPASIPEVNVAAPVAPLPVPEPFDPAAIPAVDAGFSVVEPATPMGAVEETPPVVPVIPEVLPATEPVPVPELPTVGAESVPPAAEPSAIAIDDVLPPLPEIAPVEPMGLGDVELLPAVPPLGAEPAAAADDASFFEFGPAEPVAPEPLVPQPVVAPEPVVPELTIPQPTVPVMPFTEAGPPQVEEPAPSFDTMVPVAPAPEPVVEPMSQSTEDELVFVPLPMDEDTEFSAEPPAVNEPFSADSFQLPDLPPVIPASDSPSDRFELPED